ncbi:MAG: TolB family protein [Planctomycetota bacterium]|jgi:dipeptidyl aminopeptidase/acylaminoacyl peptidase
MRLKSSFLFFLVFVGVSFFVGSSLSNSHASSSGTHPFSIHDMLAMDRLSDHQVSPDGKLIVFTIRKTDLEADKGRTDLWLIGTDGTDLRRLTSHPEADYNPRWAPEGKSVWFISTRTDSAQVWRIRIDGGEAQQVTDLPLDVGNLLVSPDGLHIAFTMEVFPDCKTIDDTKERLDEIKNRKTTGLIYEQIFVRHWDTWKDGRRSHLFVMPIAGGDVVDLMWGMDADTPSKPFGGSEEITFTTDGRGLVFSARDAGKAEPWSTDFNLYSILIDGSQPLKCLTKDNKAWDTNPVFSPDGRTLAYLAMTKPGYESDRFRIILISWPDGKMRVLTENWDRSPSSICFSADGKTIYTAATNVGQKSLFAVNVRNGSVRTIVKEGRIGSPAVAAGRIIYGMSNLQSPVELYSVEPDVISAKSQTSTMKKSPLPEWANTSSLPSPDGKTRRSIATW